MMALSTCQRLPRGRLIEVTLDPNSISHKTNSSIDRERQAAIYNILDSNSFELVDHDVGPYRLVLAILDKRFVFNVQNEGGEPLVAHLLPFSALKRSIRDYLIACEAYYQAIKDAPPSHIQAIDMDRRSLHDKGSHTLAQKLASKIKVDHDTGRRLFTLICSLHWKG